MKSVKHKVKEKVVYQCCVASDKKNLHDKLMFEIREQYPRRVISQVLRQICKQTNSHVADYFNDTDAGYTDSLLNVIFSIVKTN